MLVSAIYKVGFDIENSIPYYRIKSVFLYKNLNWTIFILKQISQNFAMKHQVDRKSRFCLKKLSNHLK